MDKILYIGQIAMEGSASCVHVQNRARFFSDFGYLVEGLSELPKNGTKIEDTSYIKYSYMSPYLGKGKIRGGFWVLDQFLGIHTCRDIIKAIKQIRPQIVILYEQNSIVVEEVVRRYCNSCNIKLIIEVSEWMETRGRKRISDRGIVWQKDYQKRQLDKKCGNIISISEYLFRHYKEQGCNVLKLPPIVESYIEVNEVKNICERRERKYKRLVFAGTTDCKDYLQPLLQALIKLNIDDVRIMLDIVGPSEQDINNLLKQKELQEYGIYCYGRKTHEDTLEIVKRADFSVLMRENKRYAKAGVSIKFVEAMSLAVPSICTKVGGTDLFVTDKKDGFLISENSVDVIYEALEKIVDMDAEQVLAMKLQALQKAKEYFSGESYVEETKQFLNAL